MDTKLLFQLLFPFHSLFFSANIISKMGNEKLVLFHRKSIAVRAILNEDTEINGRCEAFVEVQQYYFSLSYTEIFHASIILFENCSTVILDQLHNLSESKSI